MAGTQQASPPAFVYAQRPVKSPVIKAILPYSISTDDHDHLCKHFVIVKENVLDLVIYDVLSCQWRTVLEQPVFGTIRQCRVLHRSTFIAFHSPKDNPYPTNEQVSIRSLSSATTTTSPDNTQRFKPFAADDVLVCLSDSGKLSFITLVKYPHNHNHSTTPIARFCPSFEIAISPPGWDYVNSRSLLAVDPLSRSIAVASHQDLFDLFPIMTVESGLSEKMLGPRVSLVEDGFIMALTFLYPNADDLDKVQLTMALSKDQNLKIIVYEYQRHDVRGTMKKLPPLDCGNAICLQLIALPLYPESLILITETQLVLVQVRGIPTSILPISTIQLSEHGTEESLLSISALPTDLPECLALSAAEISHQTIYLASDTGLLFRTCITPPDISLDLMGRRPCAGAMAVIDVGHEDAADVLALAGQTCDGEIVSCFYEHTQPFFRHASIPCWAPVLDFKLCDSYDQGRDTSFATSGLDAGGGIRETRHGIGVAVDALSNDFAGVTGLWTLDFIDELCLLLVSYVEETRILSFADGGDNIEDISDQSGLVLVQPTLAAGVFGSMVLQVHRQGVSAVHRLSQTGQRMDIEDPCRWHADFESHIICGVIHKSAILVGLSKNNLVIQLQVSIDPRAVSVKEVNRISLDAEPTTMYIPSHPAQPTPFCIVGTYKGDARIFSLPDLQLQFTETFDIPKVDVGGGLAIPQSFMLLSSTNSTFLLTTLRDGSLLTQPWDLTTLPSVKPVRYPLGAFPARLIPTAYSESCLALSDRPWRLTISNAISLVHSGVKSYPLLCEHVVMAACYGAKAGVERFVLLEENGNLSFVRLDGNGYRFRNISLHETPRRVLYDKTSSKLLVATSGRGAGGALTEVRLVDPKSDRVCFKESLRKGELCYALTDWNVKEGKRYICVGTGGFMDTAENNPARGRVLIYNLKLHQEKLDGVKSEQWKMRKLGEFRTRNEVVAICSFARSYLLAAAGNKVYLLKIDAATRTIVCGAHVEVRWKIQSLETNGWKVIVGAQKESLTVIQYDSTRRVFDLISSDQYTRSVADNVWVDDSLVMCTDKSRNIFVVNTEQSRGEPEKSIAAQANFHTGEFILRLQYGKLASTPPLVGHSGPTQQAIFVPPEIRVPWKSSTADILASNVASSSSSTPLTYPSARKSTRASQVDGEAFYGWSVSGSLWVFERVSEVAFMILQTLEVVMRAWPSTQPLLGHNQLAYRSSVHPVRNVIDGEFVSQFLAIPPSECEALMKKWRQEWQKRLNALDNGISTVQQVDSLFSRLRNMIGMDSETMTYILHVLNRM
ncbi:hypothetical protein SeMB42_g01258 [Synchytrium endobioticum]|uniref:Cleavage/polyadenylation specificity factor A subunit N-terminal domain-containing protein n=1 Tax=Synchytrium endobioticum TaxID=286115 RepID=A0A507CRC4_9FUNG|nr:hypothetical protein SeLEV6574_g05959 [Synchytrium endobioticum]TPX52658.1 hypothetical protein SeMB42_g01258 [Synchytrium endobioticum]